MNANKIASYAIMGILFMFIMTTIISIFLTILSVVISAVFFLVFFGMIMMLMSAFAQGLESKKKEKEEESENMNTMSQEERIDVLKQQFLDGEITEEEFEQRIDEELGREKERSVEFSNQRNNLF